MKDKVVLVTGASGGLGTFVTQAFLESGATVIGSSRKITDSEFPSPRFTAIPAQLSSAGAARDLVDAVMQKFGRIDVLVHLLGAFAGGKPVYETDDETWAKMFEINLNSAFYMFRAALTPMRAAQKGTIIAIGSRAAVEPQPGISAYSASKAGLVSLVRSIAAENSDFGITANILLPGTMDTPANRAADPNANPANWVQPQGVASLVVALARDAGSQVSGAVIPVYGRDV